MYTRDSPSKRFLSCIEQNGRLHRGEGAPSTVSINSIYPGFSVVAQADRIKRLIQLTNAISLIDYGCGKGFQYQQPVIDLGLPEKELLCDYLNISGVQLYDPCVGEFSKFPEGSADGILCCDVLQLCPDEDLPWIVETLFSLAIKFVFISVACHPANKTLPNGENPHCTIRTATWWVELVQSIWSGFPDIMCELVAIPGGEKADDISVVREQVYRFEVQ